MMIDRLGTRPMIITWPIGSEADFKGIIDIVKMKALVWHDEQLGAKFDEVEIPAEYADKCAELRAALVEMAVEQDDVLLEAYLEGGKEPNEADLKRCIRKGAMGFQFVPVMCGSAFKNKGVQPLLDAVVDYLPSPLDIPPVKGTDLKGNEVERPATTRRRSRAWPSRSWTIRSSVRSPLSASIPAAFRRAPARSIRSRTRPSGSAACF